MCTNELVAQTRSFPNARKGDVYLTLAHTQGHSLFARGTSLLMPAKKGEHPKASALAGVTPGSPFSEV